MKFIVTTLTLATLFLTVHAQANPSLSALIKEKDTALFNAFNTCDLNTWRQYLASDVEFYQNNDDPTFSRDALEPSFLDRCKGGGQAVLIRELVADSHEVHTIQGVGAVQFGAHRFLLKQDDGSYAEVGTPRFVHLWENTGDSWQIIRVISYSH